MTRSRTAFALAAGATGTLVVLGASPALADSHTATVSVLHAVPDTPVDVYANGERLIDDFQPGTLTDPLQLPAGSYDLALFPADAADGSGTPLLSADGVSVPAGANATVVAHLTDAGHLEYSFGPGRGGYLYLIDGRLLLNGDSLATGDAVKVTGEAKFELSTDVAAELILIDVPLEFEPVGVWAGER